MSTPTPSMSPRQRRLMADYEAVRAELAGHPNVQVEPIGVLPPERYRITYRLPSLVLEQDQPLVAEEHTVELVLPLGYPRVGPVASPKSPVFHPNVDHVKYCIADYWSAGQPLVDIIRKIGDMLQFRVYNVRSPLNATAARWVEQNEPAGLFPIGNVDLGMPDIDVSFRAPTVEVDRGTSGDDDSGERPRTEIIL